MLASQICPLIFLIEENFVLTWLGLYVHLLASSALCALICLICCVASFTEPQKSFDIERLLVFSLGLQCLTGSRNLISHTKLNMCIN